MTEWTRALADAGFRPLAPTMARLRLAFAPWIERMRTPAAERAAIRDLQAAAPAEVAAHFALEQDGSFTIDTMMLEAEA